LDDTYRQEYGFSYGWHQRPYSQDLIAENTLLRSTFVDIFS